MAAAAELKRLGAELVAVCLLNSYANPAHEQAVREIMRREAPGIEITISSDVLAEMREYERTSTTVINAYLMPVVRKYVGSLDRTLRKQGFHAPLLLMQSNGGAMTAELGCEQPMHIIELGRLPASLRRTSWRDVSASTMPSPSTSAAPPPRRV